MILHARGVRRLAVEARSIELARHAVALHA